MEKEKEELTQSQTIKQILELCEVFGMTEEALNKVRKKCWYLADSQGEGNGNGKTIRNY
jgi:hypothetical protein